MADEISREKTQNLTVFLKVRAEIVTESFSLYSIEESQMQLFSFRFKGIEK